MKKEMTVADEQKELESRHPPCATSEWNERQNRTVWHKPPVDCVFNCEACGWNPEVANRRIKKLKAEISERKRGKKCRQKS